MASATPLLRLSLPSSPSSTASSRRKSIVSLHYVNGICTRLRGTALHNHHRDYSSLLLLDHHRPRCSTVDVQQQLQHQEDEDDKKEIPSQSNEGQKRRLYLTNLPWKASSSDIQTLLEGTAVSDIDIIKGKGGRSKGYAFVTVDSQEEAQGIIDKFDSYEFHDRIIRVEYAKSMKKPAPPPPPPLPSPATKEKKHVIYVSNLSWKVRSVNLREFFSASFKPTSARIVFDNPSGRSAGYGFVSFDTEEEALAAISELDGKELMGRPLRLLMSEKKGDKSDIKHDLAENSEGDKSDIKHDLAENSEGNKSDIKHDLAENSEGLPS